MSTKLELTPEPWFLVQNGGQIDIHSRRSEKGNFPRELTVCSNISAPAAERIVACVNACEGLETDALNRGGALTQATKDELDRLRASNAALRKELENIANAKRFSKEHFADSGEAFADWAQNRARFTLANTVPWPT